MNQTVRLAIKGRQFFLVCAAFLLFAAVAIAQTASITALIDQSCTGTWAGKKSRLHRKRLYGCCAIYPASWQCRYILRSWANINSRRYFDNLFRFAKSLRGRCVFRPGCQPPVAEQRGKFVFAWCVPVLTAAVRNFGWIGCVW